MTSRQQFVSCGVSCALAFYGSAFAADKLWDGSDSNDLQKPDDLSLNRVPVKAEFADDAVVNPRTNFPVIIGTISTVPEDITAASGNAANTVGGGDFQTPNAGYGFMRLAAVPEPAAALIGSLGLLALVRRRRG